MQYRTMRISVYSFIISAILLTASCSSINKKCKDITFGELSKDVQDTLQCVSQKVIEEDYSPQAMIDFSGKCKFTEKCIGPWIIGIQIEDTVNNVSVSLPPNAPMPYIVYKGFVYYPYEYNIVIMGINKKTKFQAIKMK